MPNAVVAMNRTSSNIFTARHRFPGRQGEQRKLREGQRGCEGSWQEGRSLVLDQRLLRFQAVMATIFNEIITAMPGSHETFVKYCSTTLRGATHSHNAEGYLEFNGRVVIIAQKRINPKHQCRRPRSSGGRRTWSFLPVDPGHLRRQGLRL